MYESYDSPFNLRYGSADMRIIFSPQNKYTNWRHLWVLLARGEKSLGLDISDEQVKELESHIWDVPYERAEEIERETHHDVMAHIKAYAEQCPNAAPIIHLGATSAFIVDNSDMMIIFDAISLILKRMHTLRYLMMNKAQSYRLTPTLAYTHFQAAQPITFGKRVCMWLQDLNDDYNRLKQERSKLRILGCKGATGTCASFLELFEGDYKKVKELDEFIANSIGIPSIGIAGQTYSRKQDYYVFSVLSGVAQTLSKMANDLRLMSGKGEFFEPFGENQVGSSAMAYKQNPLRCEKVTSLARLVINNATAIANTAANQWLERSLDDSAIRRVVIPETFLMLDEILNTMTHVMKYGKVQEGIMLVNLGNEIPKLISEGVLMLAVKRGGNRQELHEAIRQYTVLDATDFVMAVSRDERFNLTTAEILKLAEVEKLVGAAPMQVDEYLEDRI